MAKDDESADDSGGESAVRKSPPGGALDDELLLRFGLSLLPIYLRRVVLTDEPPRRRR